MKINWNSLVAKVEPENCNDTIDSAINKHECRIHELKNLKSNPDELIQINKEINECFDIMSDLQIKYSEIIKNAPSIGGDMNSYAKWDSEMRMIGINIEVQNSTLNDLMNRREKLLG